MSELCRNYVGTMSELKGLRSMHWVCDLPGLFKALARLRRQLIRSKPRSPSSSSTSHAPHADPLWISRCTRPFSFAHFSNFSIEFNPSIWIQLNSVCIRCILWEFIISAAQPDSTWLNLTQPCSWANYSLKLGRGPSQLCPTTAVPRPQAAHLKEQWKSLGDQRPLFSMSAPMLSDAYKSSVALLWLAFGCSITLQDLLKSIWNSTLA